MLILARSTLERVLEIRKTQKRALQAKSDRTRIFKRRSWEVYDASLPESTPSTSDSSRHARFTGPGNS